MGREEKGPTIPHGYAFEEMLPVAESPIGQWDPHGTVHEIFPIPAPCPG